MWQHTRPRSGVCPQDCGRAGSLRSFVTGGADGPNRRASGRRRSPRRPVRPRQGMSAAAGDQRHAPRQLAVEQGEHAGVVAGPDQALQLPALLGRLPGDQAGGRATGSGRRTRTPARRPGGPPHRSHGRPSGRRRGLPIDREGGWPGRGPLPRGGRGGRLGRPAEERREVQAQPPGGLLETSLRLRPTRMRMTSVLATGLSRPGMTISRHRLIAGMPRLDRHAGIATSSRPPLRVLNPSASVAVQPISRLVTERNVLVFNFIGRHELVSTHLSALTGTNYPLPATGRRRSAAQSCRMKATRSAFSSVVELQLQDRG